ncbi:Up in starvation [Leucoagaricus gongylophorus]
MDRPLPEKMPGAADQQPQQPQPQPQQQQQQQQPQSGLKRSRPAPAKTFQCRGYGECRMVFSRSEHLARHIRKHTGERPFTCHCTKQFSRLDNLRQHAQTVHADKQEQNESMMRDLTTLHASMTAANKISSIRTARRNPVLGSIALAAGVHSADLVKEEDLPVSLTHRPGTATGYEGGPDHFPYHWHASDPKITHSFRDSNQSFLVLTDPPAADAAPGQSFLSFPSSSLNFGFADSVRDCLPRTNSSRPPTSGPAADPNSRSLPPLSAVVSASLSSSPRQHHIQPIPAPPGSSHGQPGTSGLLLPNPFTYPRSFRPGTAPASATFFSANKPVLSGMGLSRPDLSLRSSSSFLGPPTPTSYDLEPPSPGNDASPFFFSPPGLDPPPTSPTSLNPRRRPLPGSDGSYDDSTRDLPHDGDGSSQSRPHSRRLSVMELCNDTHDHGRSPAFLPSRVESRPTTTSGLVSSASALALADRSSPVLPNTPVQSRSSPPYAAAATATASRGNGDTSHDEFDSRDRVSSTLRRNVPSPSSILSFRSGAGSSGPAFLHSPTFSAASAASCSPRSSGSATPFSPRSPISGTDLSGSVSRRAHGDEQLEQQLRFPGPSHTSPPLGLRV